MAVRDNDPVVGFQFILDVAGLTGYFTEVSGIGSENAVVTHKVVTELGKEVVLQIPGRVEWGEITLKRGLTKNFEFWTWREAVILGTTEEARVDCSITMLARDYTNLVTWNLTNAWPSKLSGPQIASDSNDFTIEELTLVHEGLTRSDVSNSIPAIDGA